MTFRSLQHLPPRSPLRSLDRGAPRWARPLAGRAGSRHRHPLGYAGQTNMLLNPLSARCRKTRWQKDL